MTLNKNSHRLDMIKTMAALPFVVGFFFVFCAIQIVWEKLSRKYDKR